MSDYLNGYSEECVAFLPMLGIPMIYSSQLKSSGATEALSIPVSFLISSDIII